MQCPKCLRDYKNVTHQTEKGFFTQQVTHDHRPYRIYGYMCGYEDCGFHATLFSVPIEAPFNRDNRAYDELDDIVAEFQEKVKSFFAKRAKIKDQHSFKFKGEDEVAA